MLARVLAVLLLLSSLSFAGVVEDVRDALVQGDFTLAKLRLQSYRGQRGTTPEYLEALSWMARAALDAKQLGSAASYAEQTESLARLQLSNRKLDAERHLPIALGAAIEVHAGVLEARGMHTQARALLRRSLAVYRGTSIEARLQKNLNVLTLTGQLAPPLQVNEYLSVRPLPLTALKGSPVLLFFWAHWCSDCKAEGPVIARLWSEFGPRGLAVVAPTQLYGYAAGGEEAKPRDELAYIGKIWGAYYRELQSLPVPISKMNFERYGASTTPTLVVLDRAGRVALYHPGVLPYEQLRAAVERAMGPG
jgi:thiol-disulfide isomerase/thioredoxin